MYVPHSVYICVLRQRLKKRIMVIPLYPAATVDQHNENITKAHAINQKRLGGTYREFYKLRKELRRSAGYATFFFFSVRCFLNNNTRFFSFFFFRFAFLLLCPRIVPTSWLKYRSLTLITTGHEITASRTRQNKLTHKTLHVDKMECFHLDQNLPRGSLVKVKSCAPISNIRVSAATKYTPGT